MGADRGCNAARFVYKNRMSEEPPRTSVRPGQPPRERPPHPIPPSGDRPEETGDGEEPGELTPEEQLARYEESLKNDDWGHQPC